MTYIITKSDGTVVATLADNSRNTTATSLTLDGKYSEYGEDFAKNFVRLCENFALPTPPSNPLRGQLWYHTTQSGPLTQVVNRLKVYNGTSWYSVNAATNQSTPPVDPQPGDLWFNPTTNQIYYWSGTAWTPISTTPSTETPPLNARKGSFWFMQPENMLWIYDPDLTTSVPEWERNDGRGNVPAGWVLVGPISPHDSGTRIVYDRVDGDEDESPGEFDILKIYVGDELIAIWSRETFTPATPIESGFTVEHDPLTGPVNYMDPGLNLKSDLRFIGTATNADLLDGLDSIQFLRRDTNTNSDPSEDIQFDLGGHPDADRNRWRGTFSNLYFAGDSKGTGDLLSTLAPTTWSDVTSPIVSTPVTGSNDPTVLSTINMFGKAAGAHRSDLLATPRNLSCINGDVTGFNLNGFDGNENVSDSSGNALLITTQGQNKIINFVWNDISARIANGATPQDPRYVLRNGTVPLTGNWNAGPWDISANNFIGTATRASFADLAERYEADAEYSPGTILMYGGEKEVTKAHPAYPHGVCGVVSTNPAYLMNAAAGTDKTHPPVAKIGRVPVLIKGKVYKGQRIVLSDEAGIGKGFDGYLGNLSPYEVLGRSIVEDARTDVRLILVAVGDK